MAKPKKQNLGEVTVNLGAALNLPSRLAHHMHVNDLGEFVQLSFFEVVFPVLSPTASEEELEAIKAGGLYGNCVARINVPKSRFQDFTQAMNAIANPSK